MTTVQATRIAIMATILNKLDDNKSKIDELLASRDPTVMVIINAVDKAFSAVNDLNAKVEGLSIHVNGTLLEDVKG